MIFLNQTSEVLKKYALICLADAQPAYNDRL